MARWQRAQATLSAAVASETEHPMATIRVNHNRVRTLIRRMDLTPAATLAMSPLSFAALATR
jgi:hypothetical protein